MRREVPELLPPVAFPLAPCQQNKESFDGAVERNGLGWLHLLTNQGEGKGVDFIFGGRANTFDEDLDDRVRRRGLGSGKGNRVIVVKPVAAPDDQENEASEFVDVVAEGLVVLGSREHDRCRFPV